MISLADLHCDTLYKCFVNGGDLTQSNLHINLRHIRDFDRYVQVFAHYIPEQTKNKWDYFKAFVENSRAILQKCKIPIFADGTDLEKKHLAVLSVEGGDLFDETEDVHERILYLKQCGIKFFSMIYNRQNNLGTGCAEKIDTGLTDFGKEIIPLLNQSNIVLDVSHASYQSTEDILNLSKRPVCATHSNAMAVTSHRRNLSDKHLKAIAESGGLVGVNFYPPFLSENSPDISAICKHIDYLSDRCGENGVSFGCDLDGIDALPKDILNLSSLNDVYFKMQKMGYSEDFLDKLFFENILKFMKNNFGG